jgi:hypothetical protein
MNNFEQEKKKLTDALSKPVKISSDIKKADKKLKEHIGFEKEKETFINHIKIYSITQGQF